MTSLLGCDDKTQGLVLFSAGQTSIFEIVVVIAAQRGGGGASVGRGSV